MSELHVICRIDEAEFAIPASEVLQMESYSPVTPVPGVLPYVDGLLQVRSQVIPIINSRIRFGFPPGPITAETRFVILNLGKRLVGLLVDSAREVKKISPDDFKNPSEFLTDANGFVRAVTQIKDRIIWLMDTEKVVGEEQARG